MEKVSQPNPSTFGPETVSRAERLRVMMNEYIRSMPDAERDRRMQVHLAEARGTEMNAYLLGKAMNFAITLRAAKRDKDTGDDR